jgi:hypothetical protein
MDIITAALIAGIQRQRVKIQKIMRKEARAAKNALKRWDLSSALTHGAKAVAAQQFDQYLAQQQTNLRKASG